MKKILRSNLYFVMIIALEFIVPLVFKRVFLMIGDTKIQLALSHFMCFLVPAIIFIVVTRSNPKELLKVNKISIKQFGIIVGIAFLCQPIMTACSGISAMFFENNISSFVSSIVKSPVLVLIFLMAIMPAITEEITIRGIVLSGYEKVSDIKAAIITGIMFGIFHLDLQQFLYAAVLGVILGYVVRVTNSILSSMTIHFLINATSVITSIIIMRAGNVVNDSGSNTLTSLPLEQKIVYIGVYIAIAMIFGTIVCILMQKLKEISFVRNNEAV